MYLKKKSSIDLEEYKPQNNSLPRTKQGPDSNIDLQITKDSLRAELHRSIGLIQFILVLLITCGINIFAWSRFLRQVEPSADDMIFPFFGLLLFGLIVWLKFGKIILHLDSKDIRFSRKLLMLSLSKSRPISSIQKISLSQSDQSNRSSPILIQFEEEQQWRIDAGLSDEDKQWLAGEIDWWVRRESGE